MSSQPKPTEVEDESEYETESETEDVVIEEDEDGSQPLEFDEEDFGDFIQDDDDTLMKVADIAGSLFATDEGDTVCSALVNISKQLEMQNRIMVKILAQMQKYA